MKKQKKKDIGLFPPKTIAILVAAILLIVILWWFLPLRIFVGISLLLLVVSSVILVRGIMSHHGFKTEWLLYTLGALGVSFVGLLETGTRYTFIDEPFLAFWEISLILGILTSGFFILKFGRGGKLWAKIVGVLLGALVSAVIIGFVICHLNFVLDFHESDTYSVRIEEKNRHWHVKSADTYSFTITVDGETIDLEVGFLEYEKYEKGDIYTVKKHQGAFGKPFYVSD